MEGGHLSSHWLLALGASYKLLKAKHQPGFPGGLSGEESTCQRRRGETRVPSLSREDPLEEGVAAPPRPLPRSCLENPMDRGAWRAAVHGVAVSRMQMSTQITGRMAVVARGQG